MFDARRYAPRKGNRPIKARRGFTLVELLVVIAIISVLIALLLPAIAASRRAANRSVSQNNLRQLAFAAFNFSNAKGYLPPGWSYSTKTNSGSLTDQNANVPYYSPVTWSSWSGIVDMLPYLEQGKAYAAIDKTHSPYDLTNPLPGLNIANAFNGTFTMQRLDFLINPNNTSETDPNAGGILPWTDYRLNAGTYAIDATSPGDITSNSKGNTYDNGPFYANSKTSPAGIPDGASTTIMMGESQQGTKSFVTSGTSQPLDTWADGWQGIVATPILSSDAGVDDIYQQPFPTIMGFYDMTTIPNRLPYAFWGGGQPNNGASFIMCDGSARMISDKVNGQVFRSLLTRNGGLTGVQKVDQDPNYIDMLQIPDAGNWENQ